MRKLPPASLMKFLSPVQLQWAKYIIFGLNGLNINTREECFE